jgi:hypothetical protein
MQHSRLWTRNIQENSGPPIVNINKLALKGVSEIFVWDGGLGSKLYSRLCNE